MQDNQVNVHVDQEPSCHV